MDISTSSNVVTINDNIKSVNDFQAIKSAIDKIIVTHKNVTLNIIDSISMTSSVIGYLNKIVLKDKINLTVNVGNAQLLELFEELNLSSTLKVHKI